jgi:hypothetical protein
MMMLSSLQILVVIATTTTTSAFSASSSFFASSPARTMASPMATTPAFGRKASRRYVQQSVYEGGDEESYMVGEECIITPEGFGFTTPTNRVLREAKRGVGYYRASASDLVIDVMDGITSGEQDVALVFDDKDSQKLLGLFTETDYIKVRNVAWWTV